MRSNTHDNSAIQRLEPRLFLAAQAYDWKAAVIKANGFIDGIVYSPAAPNVVYIHTDMGGAYRWDQGAGKWMPLNDWSRWDDWAPQNLGVETMAVDPTDPNRVYMAAGTYMSPTAILRSTDQGRTWLRTDVSGINSNGNGSARNAGERMVVDPNSPNILYYGTRDDGLWKSTDYAATWTRVNSFPTIGLDSGWGQDTGIVFTIFDKSSATPGNATPKLYAGVFDPTGGVSRIYRTTNGGTTWEAIPGGQPTTADFFPQRAAITPDGQSLYITYGSSTSYPGPFGIVEGAVFKASDPGGGFPGWQDISPPVTYGFSAVALDPVDPNTVFVSELGNYNPADRIWKNTTGGQVGNWVALSPNGNRNDTSAPYATSLGVHWMGDLQVDPFNRNVAMFTTGYGLYRTTNLLSGNPSWSFFNEGFEQSAVLELASPSTGSVNLLSAIGDRDGYRHADLNQSPSIGRHGQSNGQTKGTSDDIDVAYDNGDIAVRTFRSSPYLQYTNDNGVTWVNFPSTGTSNSGSNANFVAISADGTKAVYEPGGTGRARYATRTGITWSGWTTPATNQPLNNAQVVAEQVAGSQTFYAYVRGSTSGPTASRNASTVYRTTDGGANWTTMTATAPSGLLALRAVPGQAGHMIMTRDFTDTTPTPDVRYREMFRSTDGGATWTQVAAAATPIQVGVGAGPTVGSYPSIYVFGTVNGQPGFHRSDDQGVTWTMISDLAHQFGYVTVIQGDARVYGRLYVGTNGRGVQYGDIHSSPASFPMNWSTQDIGSPGSVGAAGGSAGAFELIGGGAGIPAPGANSDQFRYAYTSLAGDGSITARVVSNPSASPANNNAKAGVMIRNTLASNSAHAFTAMTPGSVNGAVFQSRSTAGTSTSSTNFTGVWNPYWVRLTRSANTFTAERSPDGANWFQVGAPQTIAMNTTVHIGLAVTSSDNNHLNIATFDNVSVNAVATPVSITGTPGPDSIRLVRNGAMTDVWIGGSVQQSFDPATASSLTVNALAGDDTITLDFSNGNPLSSNTTIDGGDDQDTLAVVGSSAADAATFGALSIDVSGATGAHANVEGVTFDGAGGADDVTVNAGATLSFPTTQRLDSLNVAGSVVVAPNASSGLGIRTSALSLTGTLDLTNNDLILDYTGASQLIAIQTLISSTRLISSSTITKPGTTLGAIEASDYRSIWGQNAPFDGESIAGVDAVLVKYTWNGDTDFSGSVNFDDYVRVDIGFNTGRTGWLNGDFNGSGAVNFDDYVLIDIAFNVQDVVL